MKRFLLKTVLFFFLVLAVLAAGIFFHPEDTESYSSEIVKKHARLDSMPQPRVVFIAGSNFAFGLDSAAFEAGTGLPAVNMGLHAGAGLYFMLDSTVSKIKPGDIVVFAFEYALFLGEADGNEEVSSEFFAMPESLPDLRFRVLRSVMNGAANYSFVGLHERFTEARHAVKYLFVKPKPKKTKTPDVYSAAAFNDDCDVVAHLDLPPRKFHSSPLGGSVDFDAVAAFREAVFELRSRGVHVLIFPPVFNKTSFEKNRKKIDELARVFSENEIPFCVEPARYALPDEMFFDTTHHCGASGRRERTRLLIEDFLRLSK